MSADARMGVTWFEPTSVALEYFVDREELRAELMAVLEERLSRKGSYSICVTGLRGVGKSIFSRWCLDSFARKHAGRVIAVTVDLRMVSLVDFLRDFIKQLAQQTRVMLDRVRTSGTEDPQTRELRRRLDEMVLLAQNETVTESQTEQVTRQYGIGASLKGGLLEVLEASNTFSWQESRGSAGALTRSFKVTPDLMHRALREVLRDIATWTPFLAVVLFDDLDQIRTDDIKTAVRNVLDIQDCVRIVHLRREAQLGDVSREMDYPIEVPPLHVQALSELVSARVASASAYDQTLFASVEVREALASLCRATGNPLVLLRWLTAIARRQLFTPANIARWREPESLEHIVRDSLIGAPRLGLLKSIAEAQDRAEELSPGIFASTDFRAALSPEALQEAMRLELLGLVDRESSESGFWVDGRLALLRPSTQKALREGP